VLTPDHRAHGCHAHFELSLTKWWTIMFTSCQRSTKSTIPSSNYKIDRSSSSNKKSRIGSWRTC
jgi:hypothetical protein